VRPPLCPRRARPSWPHAQPVRPSARVPIWNNRQPAPTLLLSGRTGQFRMSRAGAVTSYRENRPPPGGSSMTRRPDPAQLIQTAARAAGLGQRSDTELLSAFLDRNESSAFEALVRRHGPLVWGACRHVPRAAAAAEDAFQGPFTLLSRTAGSTRNRPSLGGWLFRVARRCASNVRRSAERRERREARAARRETTLPTDASWREALAILHEELDRLPDLYRPP